MRRGPPLKLKAAAEKLGSLSEDLHVPMVAVIWDDETKGCVVMVAGEHGNQKTAVQDAIEVLKLDIDQGDGVEIPQKEELPS